MRYELKTEMGYRPSGNGDGYYLNIKLYPPLCRGYFHSSIAERVIHCISSFAILLKLLKQFFEFGKHDSRKTGDFSYVHDFVYKFIR